MNEINEAWAFLYLGAIVLIFVYHWVLEGIAYHNGWITAAKLRELAQPMLRNQYGQYLLKLTDENRR